MIWCCGKVFNTRRFPIRESSFFFKWPYEEFISIVPNVKGPQNNEFIITMRKGPKKTDSMRFSTDHRADLLSEALVSCKVKKWIRVCSVDSMNGRFSTSPCGAVSWLTIKKKPETCKHCVVALHCVVILHLIALQRRLPSKNDTLAIVSNLNAHRLTF